MQIRERVRKRGREEGREESTESERKGVERAKGRVREREGGSREKRVGRMRGRVYIEGTSSRCLNAPPLCTEADDLLRCSATVGNLGERGEPDILT